MRIANVAGSDMPGRVAWLADRARLSATDDPS
jgi:hypothetical protein